MRRPSGAVGVRWGAVVALVGALVGVIGTFLPWALLTAVGSLVTPAQTTVGVAGIRHWTGLAAMVASGVAVLGGVGAGMFEDAAGRRQAAAVAAAAGALALVAALVGLSQREEIATSGLPGGREALAFATDFAAEFNEEFELSIPPPRVEAGAGVFATMAGAAAATAGGLLVLRQESPRRRGLRFGR
jgi:hypothetical protein